MANQRTAALLKDKGYHYHFVLCKGAGHVDGKAVGETLPDALLLALARLSDPVILPNGTGSSSVTTSACPGGDDGTIPVVALFLNFCCWQS